MKDYIRHFFYHSPQKVALGGVLMLVCALLEGIGLLILIPLLALVGIQQSPGTSQLGQLSEWLATHGITLTLPSVLIGFVFIIVIQAWLLRRRTILLYTLQLTFVDDIRKQLYQAVTRTNWTFLTSKHSADFSHVLTSDIQRVGVGTHFLLTLSSTLVMMTAYLIIAIKLSVSFTLLALLSGLFLWFLLRRENKRASSAGQALSRTHQRIHHHLTEHLGTMHLIKAHGLYDAQAQLFEKEVDSQRHSQLDFQRINSRVRMHYKMLGALILAALVYLAVEILELPGVTVLVLIAIFARTLPMLSSFQSGYQHVLHMLPAYQSWKTLLDDCNDHREPLSPQQQHIDLNIAINIEALRFNYPRGEFKLDIDRLQLPAGKSTAIVGASGSGKSTLVDLLLGLHRPGAGTIQIDDQVLGPDNIGSWRNHIAYVPQETQLFDLSLRENLCWGQDDCPDDETILNSLEQVALLELLNSLPDGLDTRIGERGVQFSGGERQRLALARALLRQPSCLILDEATSALGSTHQQAISRLLEALPDTMTVIIIAHQLETLQHADFVALMENGRLKSSGSWQQMSSSVNTLFGRPVQNG